MKAAINILSSRLEELRQEVKEALDEAERAARYATDKAQALADVEQALRALGVDPAEVSS